VKLGLRRESVKASARTGPSAVPQRSHFGSYTPVGISRSQSRRSVARPSAFGTRNTMPRQLPPESRPNTRPGTCTLPRFTRLHIFSARCQPRTQAWRRSMKSNSGRQMSEP
jgi:hypothetical protein